MAVDRSAYWYGPRLASLGSVMSRYATHLCDGDRVRLGIEGDPCARTYRSAATAPVGTVRNLQRKGGRVTFAVDLDDGSTRLLNDHSIHPDDAWELDPSAVAAFRGRLRADDADDADDAPDDPIVFDEAPDEKGAEVEFFRRSNSGKGALSHTEGGEEIERPHRSSDGDAALLSRLRGASEGDDETPLHEELRSLKRQFRRAEEEHRSFRETMATAVRHLAGGVLGAPDGSDFSKQFVDRYDAALSGTEEGEMVSEVPYRAAPDRHASPKPPPARRAANASDRHAFSYSELSAGEGTGGTDLSD